MTISGKYEILDLIHDDGEIQTHRARHQTLSNPLMFHRVRENAAQKLMDLLARLPEAQKDLFTDADDDEAGPYLVSRTLPEFDNLRAWISRRIPSSKVLLTSSKGDLADPNTATVVPGEFTRMFSNLKANPSGQSVSSSKKSEFSNYFFPNKTGGPDREPMRSQESAASDRQVAGANEALYTPKEAFPVDLTPTIDSGHPLNSSSLPPLPPANKRDVISEPRLSSPSTRSVPDDVREWPSPQPTSGENYTIVVKNRKSQPSGSIGGAPTAASPAVPAGSNPPPKTGDIPQETKPVDNERWYWIAIVGLAVFALGIVVLFSFIS